LTPYQIVVSTVAEFYDRVLKRTFPDQHHDE
jgi:hypothetical protein